MTLPGTPQAEKSGQSKGARMIESESEKSAIEARVAKEMLEKIQATARGLRAGHELFTVAQIGQIAEACADRSEPQSGRVVEEFTDWLGLKLARAA